MDDENDEPRAIESEASLPDSPRSGPTSTSVWLVAIAAVLIVLNPDITFAVLRAVWFVIAPGAGGVSGR